MGEEESNAQKATPEVVKPRQRSDEERGGGGFCYPNPGVDR